MLKTDVAGPPQSYWLLEPEDLMQGLVPVHMPQFQTPGGLESPVPGKGVPQGHPPGRTFAWTKARPGTKQPLPFLAITAEGHTPAGPDSRKKRLLCKRRPNAGRRPGQPAQQKLGRPTLGWVPQERPPEGEMDHA